MNLLQRMRRALSVRLAAPAFRCLPEQPTGPLGSDDDRRASVMDGADKERIGRKDRGIVAERLRDVGFAQVASIEGMLRCRRAISRSFSATCHAICRSDRLMSAPRPRSTRDGPEHIAVAFVVALGVVADGLAADDLPDAVQRRQHTGIVGQDQAGSSAGERSVRVGSCSETGLGCSEKPALFRPGE